MPVKCQCSSSARARQVPAPAKYTFLWAARVRRLPSPVSCPDPASARGGRVLVPVDCPNVSAAWAQRPTGFIDCPSPAALQQFFVVAFRSFTSISDLATWLRGAEEVHSAVEDGPSHPTGSVCAHRYHIFGRSHGRLVPNWPNLFVLFFVFWDCPSRSLLPVFLNVWIAVQQRDRAALYVLVYLCSFLCTASLPCYFFYYARPNRQSGPSAAWCGAMSAAAELTSRQYNSPVHHHRREVRH